MRNAFSGTRAICGSRKTFSGNLNLFQSTNLFRHKITLWPGTTKNPDLSTRPLARPFAHSLTLLTHLLVPQGPIPPRAPLYSVHLFVCSLTHSRARGIRCLKTTYFCPRVELNHQFPCLFAKFHFISRDSFSSVFRGFIQILDNSHADDSWKRQMPYKEVRNVIAWVD